VRCAAASLALASRRRVSRSLVLVGLVGVAALFALRVVRWLSQRMRAAPPIPMRTKRIRERSREVPVRCRTAPVNQARKRPMSRTREDRTYATAGSYCRLRLGEQAAEEVYSKRNEERPGAKALRFHREIPSAAKAAWIVGNLRHG